MPQQEGVIKYRLNHKLAEPPEPNAVLEINSWRSIMYRLGLIGQSTVRYDGLGYGNISQRFPSTANSFFISGTQTGHIESLTAKQYCLVNSADITHNVINSSGPCKPSSEALTHACIYQHSSQAKAIIHSHCPEIWRQTEALNLAYTAADIAYGTTEMADAVAQLISSNQLKSSSIFSMLGHEDGIVSFGKTITEAAWLMIKHLNSAIQIEQVTTNQ